MKPIQFFFLTLAILCLPASAFAVNLGSVQAENSNEIIVSFQELPQRYTFHASDFRLMIDQEPVTTAYRARTVDTSVKPVALVLAVHINGPPEKNRIDELKSALFLIIGRANTRQGDRIALVLFADDLKIAASFEHTRLQLTDIAMNLNPGKSANRLYDHLNQTLDLFKGSDLPKQRRIILISYGKDDGSNKTSENVLSKAKALDVTIDAIEYRINESKQQQTLKNMAEFTGGRFIDVTSGDVRLATAIASIYENIINTRFLNVHFQYDADLEAGKTATASIEVNQPGPEKPVFHIPGKFAPVKQAAPLPPAPQIPEEQIPEQQPPETKVLTIPANKPQSQPLIVQTKSWAALNMILIVFCVLITVVISIILIFLYHRKLKKAAPKKIRETIYDQPEHETMVLSSPSPQRVTLVGGYIYPPPKPGSPCAALMGIDGPLKDISIAIDKALLYIGQGEENDFCITDDDYVSKSHAYLRYEKGSLFVFDNGSKRGTFVNWKKIVNTGVALEPADQIQIGQSIFEIRKHFIPQEIFSGT